MASISCNEFITFFFTNPESTNLWTFSQSFMFHFLEGSKTSFSVMTNTYDQSIGSTETKYIKPNTKTQNNIVISWIFHKKWFCYFGFFWKKLTEIRVFTKKISGFSFWLLSFLVLRLSNGLIIKVVLQFEIQSLNRL